MGTKQGVEKGIKMVDAISMFLVEIEVFVLRALA